MKKIILICLLVAAMLLGSVSSVLAADAAPANDAVAAMQAKLDILFLLFDRLAQCRYGLVEGLGRCLDNLLCLGARCPKKTCEQQGTQKELFFHGIVVV